MKYKVYGMKNQYFTVTVNATSPEEAASIANNMSSHLWSEVESDDIIEAVDVVDYELGNR